MSDWLLLGWFWCRRWVYRKAWVHWFFDWLLRWLWWDYYWFVGLCWNHYGFGGWFWLWSRWEWLWHLGGHCPSLVESIVAVPEDNVSVVFVLTSVNVKTFLSIVSDVSEFTSVVGNLLVDFVLVCSDDSSATNSESLSSLVGNSHVSATPSSNGS
jgi:hypothetical protein